MEDLSIFGMFSSGYYGIEMIWEPILVITPLKIVTKFVFQSGQLSPPISHLYQFYLAGNNLLWRSLVDTRDSLCLLKRAHIIDLTIIINLFIYLSNNLIDLSIKLTITIYYC